MQRISIDQPYRGYLSEVNRAFEEKSGVRYMEIQKTIHPNMEALKDAFDRGASVQDFVVSTMDMFGFIASSDYGDITAKAYNTAKAALLEFVIEDDRWVRGLKGAFYMQTDAGVAEIRPEANENGEFRFVIDHLGGAELDDYGRRLKSKGQIIGTFQSADIGDALDKFDRVLGKVATHQVSAMSM